MAVVNLDDEQELITSEREFRKMSRKKSEVVIYYRRPQAGICAGWIIWSDSQPGKRSDMLIRGFIPLPKYGRLWDEPTDRDGRLFNDHGPWGPILSRPGGPEEFPVEQLLAYRWYRPENVPVPGVRFPQLGQWVAAGNKIREYPCPDCAGKTYLQVVHLARHLHISHDWDRADIIAWAALQGYDLKREFTAQVVEYQYREPDAPAPPAFEPEPSFVEVVQTPTLAQAQTAPKPCRYCAQAQSGACKRHKGRAA